MSGDQHLKRALVAILWQAKAFRPKAFRQREKLSMNAKYTRLKVPH